jgi:hypothetical protein
MGKAIAARVGRPWYADGLRFECSACGRCCGGGPGYVWTSEAEAEAMARHLGLDPGEFRRLYARRLWRGLSLREKSNYDCILLDGSGRCSAYPVRPRQCRTWPFWPGNLASRSAWSAAGRRCPGIGQGPLWTFEEIEARRLEMTG